MFTRQAGHALAASALAASTLSATAFAQPTPQPQALTASGLVFHDLNRDGLRQPSEPGIGGVAVSDGVQVTTTDAMGRYRLDIDANDARVFVIKPRGYQVRLDGLNMPRGYYIHKPAGSPDRGFIFPGLEPTGPLPPSIDFPLTSNPEPEAFTVIALGDPQAYSLQQMDLFAREVVDPVITPDGNAHHAAFGISLGDLVGDLLTLFEPLNRAQALFGVPWYNVYGNHDMNFLSGASPITQHDPDRYADETFERVFGPPDTAFQWGRVHFILLDDVIHEGFKGYEDRPDPLWPSGRKPVTSTYKGGLREHQLAFIDRYLDVVPKDDLVVLAFHIPMEMQGEGVHRIPQKAELLRILSSHPHTLSLSGHTHVQQHWFFGPADGYRPAGVNQHTELDPDRFPQPVHHHLNANTVSGSWYNGFRDEAGVPHTTMADGAPNGYTLIHFNGRRYSTEFRAARREPEHQMTIHIDAPAIATAGAAAGGEEIIVNVFNGAAGDRVQMRLIPGPSASGPRPAPGPWAPMAHSPRRDPLYTQAWERERDLPEHLRSSWGLPEPIISQHIWSAQLPAGLPAGTHALEIRHTDLYGQIHEARHAFRVER